MDTTENKTAYKDFSEKIAQEANERLQLRMTAVALYMLGDTIKEPPNLNESWTLGQNLIGSVTIGTIQRASGGLAHALVNNNRIILLPRITNSEQCHAIYGDLLCFFNTDLPNTNWIIDCSTLTELPILLLSNLIAYTHKIRSRGANLHLCWFKPEFIPEKQRQKLCDFFHLKLVGGYLFSKIH